jgi:hypothetical protein
MKKKTLRTALSSACMMVICALLLTCSGPYSDPGMDDAFVGGGGGGGGSSPIDVVIAFSKALAANDIARARNYVTPESVALLEIGLALGGDYSEVPPRN